MTAPNALAGRQPLILAVCLFALSLAFFGSNNGFSYLYAKETRKKADQVVEGWRNLHHPALMLTIADAAVGLFKLDRNRENVVRVGRWASAVYAALGATLLALVAYRFAGLIAGITAGLFLLFQPLIFELAHYFKEDSLLLLGMACVCFAAILYWDKQTLLRLTFLGFSCAFATSGKYAGVGSLLIAFPLVLLASHHQRGRIPWAHVLVFLGGFAGFVLLLNIPALGDQAQFAASLGREVEFVVHGHATTTRSVPHLKYLDVFKGQIGIAASFFVAVSVASLGRGRPLPRPRTPAWLMLIYVLAFTAVLSFSPKVSERYYLPVVGVMAVFVGTGVAVAAGFLRERLTGRKVLQQMVPALCSAVAVLPQVPRTIECHQSFRNETRTRLAEFIRENLPADAVIASETRIYLGEFELPTSMVPAELVSPFLPDAFSVDQLRERGVTHVAVYGGNSNKYTKKNLRPKKGQEEEFRRRKSFYEELAAETEAVWQCKGGRIGTLEPSLILYRIAPGRRIVR